MGLGMQIVYFGFPGSAAIEAEAAVQLLRLERFSGVLQACHLAIESVHTTGHDRTYDVRLDLISAQTGFTPLFHSVNVDPAIAIHEAFDRAERELQLASASNCAAKDGCGRRDH